MDFAAPGFCCKLERLQPDPLLPHHTLDTRQMKVSLSHLRSLLTVVTGEKFNVGTTIDVTFYLELPFGINYRRAENISRRHGSSQTV